MKTQRDKSVDTIHRISPHNCDPAFLFSSIFNHLTACSAELIGRSYGGGVLEFVPTPAEKLLVPNSLDRAVPLEVADVMIREKCLADLLDENDRIIMQQSLGLSISDCQRLKDIWIKMKNYRMNQGKRSKI